METARVVVGETPQRQGGHPERRGRNQGASARGDLKVQLLLLHDAQEDGLTDDKVVEHVRRPAVADYLYSLVERHGAVA